MSDKKKILILFICLNLIMLLQSCSSNNFIIIDYPSSFYVTCDNTKFGYQFAYDGKINEFDIVSFETETKRKYNYEFIKEETENGAQMKINNYYIYGIVFDFGFENDTFKSFDIKINNNIEKTIELNMEINTVESFENGDILPLSVPFIGTISEEVEWVILPVSDIKITNIRVINSQNSNYSILVNSIVPDFEHFYASKEKIYISANFEYDEMIVKDYMYLSISYVDSNNEEKYYNTDVSILGNDIDELRSKIC